MLPLISDERSALLRWMLTRRVLLRSSSFLLLLHVLAVITLSVWFGGLLCSPPCWFRNIDQTFRSGQRAFVSLTGWIYGNMSLHVAFGQISITEKKKSFSNLLCPLSCNDRPIWFLRVTHWCGRRNKGIEEVWDALFEKQHIFIVCPKTLQPFKAIFRAV